MSTVSTASTAPTVSTASTAPTLTPAQLRQYYDRIRLAQTQGATPTPSQSPPSQSPLTPAQQRHQAQLIYHQMRERARLAQAQGATPTVSITPTVSTKPTAPTTPSIYLLAGHGSLYDDSYKPITVPEGVIWIENEFCGRSVADRTIDAYINSPIVQSFLQRTPMPTTIEGQTSYRNILQRIINVNISVKFPGETITDGYNNLMLTFEEKNKADGHYLYPSGIIPLYVESGLRSPIRSTKYKIESKYFPILTKVDLNNMYAHSIYPTKKHIEEDSMMFVQKKKSGVEYSKLFDDITKRTNKYGLTYPTHTSNNLNLGPNAPSNLNLGPNAHPNLNLGPNAHPNLNLGPNAPSNLNLGPNAHPNLNLGPNAPPINHIVLIQAACRGVSEPSKSILKRQNSVNRLNRHIEQSKLKDLTLTNIKGQTKLISFVGNNLLEQTRTLLTKIRSSMLPTNFFMFITHIDSLYKISAIDLAKKDSEIYKYLKGIIMEAFPKVDELLTNDKILDHIIRLYDVGKQIEYGGAIGDHQFPIFLEQIVKIIESERKESDNTTLELLLNKLNEKKFIAICVYFRFRHKDTIDIDTCRHMLMIIYDILYSPERLSILIKNENVGLFPLPGTIGSLCRCCIAIFKKYPDYARIYPLILSIFLVLIKVPDLKEEVKNIINKAEIMPQTLLAEMMVDLKTAKDRESELLDLLNEPNASIVIGGKRNRTFRQRKGKRYISRKRLSKKYRR